MRSRYRPGHPPLPGPPRDTGPEIIELRSQAEQAGEPLPPPVEMRAGGPPLEITEAGPLPLPPPFDRTAALADLQSAFALLTDDELQVARQRMHGIRLEDIGEDLGMGDEEVEKLWKQARRKLGNAIFGKK